MNCCSIVIILASLLGVILIIVGAVLGFSVLPDYVHDELGKQVRLENGTDQYKRWEKLPFPLNFKVYIFEIKNPKEVLAGTQKPLVVERGPYVYKQHRRKEDITYNEEDDTLTYKQYQNFEFDQESSGKNTEADEFYVLNTPLYGVFQTMEMVSMTDKINDLWEDAFEGHDMEGPFIKIKVRDYLFDGVEFCVNKGKYLCNTIEATAGEIKTLELTENGVSFAFFRFKDGHHDGEYTITAGMDVVEDLGLIQSWEGTNVSTVWNEDGTCNDIKGRDSTIYPPYNEEEDIFDIFSTDICRVVTLEYYGQEEYKGVEGQRRHLRKDTLNNSVEANSCYCTKWTANLDGSREECLPDGFVDLYTCMKAMVVLSFPHFLWADEQIADTVDGLDPNEDEHITYVIMEPGTGYPLKGAKRVQFNMVFRPIDGITMTEKLPKAMMPLVWVEEGVNLPDDLIDELNDKYLDKLVLVDAVTWTLIAVGIALFIGFGAWFIFKKK